MKRTAIVLLCIFESIACAGAQEHSTKQRHWQVTESETLWVQRYSNCQYGYYVRLSAGLIAHAERPPSPHHGFLISLPDVGSKTEVSPILTGVRPLATRSTISKPPWQKLKGSVSVSSSRLIHPRAEGQQWSDFQVDISRRFIRRYTNANGACADNLDSPRAMDRRLTHLVRLGSTNSARKSGPFGSALFLNLYFLIRPDR